MFFFFILKIRNSLRRPVKRKTLTSMYMRVYLINRLQFCFLKIASKGIRDMKSKTKNFVIQFSAIACINYCKNKFNYLIIHFEFEIFVLIRQEEGQYDVDPEEDVDNLIENKQSLRFVLRKSQIYWSEVTCKDQKKREKCIPSQFFFYFQDLFTSL